MITTACNPNAKNNNLRLQLDSFRDCAGVVYKYVVQSKYIEPFGFSKSIIGFSSWGIIYTGKRGGPRPF